MNTTNLFIELIVIGIGTALWGMILFLFLFDIDISSLPFFQAKHEWVWTLILLPFIYILGIVTDRLADMSLSTFTTHLSKQLYPNKAQILMDKVVIYKAASPLVDMINYGRSRMRICRGWLFNLPFLLIILNLWIIKNYFSWCTILTLNIIGALTIIAFFLAWKNLTIKEYEKLKRISHILRNEV